MASYNRVILMGNLTRDPEYKQLSSGQAVCRLGVASNRQFKNKQTGSMVQEVCYIDVDVWGPQAESCRQFLAKGRPVLIEGRIKLDSWQDSDGQRRSKHSIVADRVTFLGSSAPSEDIDMAGDEPAVLVEPVREAAAPARKAKTSAYKPASKPATNASLTDDEGVGEVVLKDEEPFEDDLPF